MSIPLEKPFAIVVEGQDDVAVVELILRHLRLDTAQVINAKGKDIIGVIAGLDGFRNTVRGVAIVRDADADPAAASQACRDSLLGLEKRTAVFLLPGEGPGILEDLCLRSLEGRPELECVDRYMECIRANDISLSGPAKFRMRAMLAALADGKDQRTEWAAVSGLLDPAHAAFAPLRQFLLDFTGV